MTEMFQQKSFQKLSDTTYTVVMTDSSAGWVKGFSHTVTTEQPAQQQDSFSINSLCYACYRVTAGSLECEHRSPEGKRDSEDNCFQPLALQSTSLLRISAGFHHRRPAQRSYLWPGRAPAALRSPPPPRWGRGWEEGRSGTGTRLEQRKQVEKMQRMRHGG